jgi:hypothetical protein
MTMGRHGNLCALQRDPPKLTMPSRLERQLQLQAGLLNGLLLA